jgi:hypothetical protein
LSRLKDDKGPSNASIATHADAVVDVDFDASYEVQPFDNGNDNVIEIESDGSSHIACVATTAINLPYAWSTTTTITPQHYHQQLQQLQELKPRNFHHVTTTDDDLFDTKQQYLMMMMVSRCIPYKELGH